MLLAMQPEQANFLLNAVYLPTLKHEHRVTKSVLQAIPLDKGDYRPDGISKSALDLAWHIAATEMRFLDCVLSGAFDTSPRPMPEAIKNSDDLVAWYAGNFMERFEKLTRVPDEHLIKMIDFRGMFQQEAVQFLSLTMRHSIHHRGQLSMYLRPMGAKVPAIYGESFDSAEERKAKQQQA